MTDTHDSEANPKVINTLMSSVEELAVNLASPAIEELVNSHCYDRKGNRRVLKKIGDLPDVQQIYNDFFEKFETDPNKIREVVRLNIRATIEQHLNYITGVTR